ncbi:hypothetical protein [Paeniglutamicibacter antarcticus]|uniref:Uncharacterized protein n=1 Tax=Paeniglutamicibacter antarcticus TaxID=494023 RepID=A0ABP9TP34_9MICC
MALQFIAADAAWTALAIVVAHWVTASWTVGITAGALKTILSTARYPAPFWKRRSVFIGLSCVIVGFATGRSEIDALLCSYP